MLTAIRVLIIFNFVFGLSCSQIQINESEAEKKQARVKVAPVFSQAADESEEQIVTEKESDQEQTMVAEPVMVSGAFLVCRYNIDLFCRLDTEERQNVTPTKNYTVRVLDQSQGELGFITFDENEEYRWKVELADAETITEVRFQVIIDEEILEYVIYTDFRLLQIGDNPWGAMSQGCAPSFGRNVTFVQTPYSKGLDLPSAGKLNVQLSEVCDILRENDTFVRVVDAQGIILYQQFLEGSEKITSVSFDVDIPAAGNYQVQLVSGKSADIEDFKISSLQITFIAADM